MQMRNFVNACVGLSLALLPLSAYALTVRMPQPRSVVDALEDALSDGSVSGADAASEAFTQMWNAMGDAIADTNICQEANTRTRDAGGATTFTITVDVVGGGKTVSYPQQIRAIPYEGIIVIVMIMPDGSYGRRWSCGRAYGNAPSSEPLREIEDHPALHEDVEQLNFATQFGSIAVFLPSDMRAGDTISGTVFVEPEGDTDAERQANAGRLSGYAIDVGGAQTRVGEHIVRFTVGAGVTDILVGVTGDGSSQAGIVPVNGAPPAGAATFSADPLTQAGHPTPVQGPFDGDASNTTATMGDQNCPILAESPRQVVVMAPGQPTGNVPLNVTEQGQPALQTNISNIAVSLETPRTTLRRGERTQVTMRVAGLQGLPAPVVVDLWASESVRLQGGNQQAITIQPQPYDAPGDHVQNFGLQVLETGPFDVTATVRR
jgi:hypothetical protein